MTNSENLLLTFVRRPVTMTRMRYVVTGGTGFIGRRLIAEILSLPGTAAVHVLVRTESLGRFDRLAVGWADERVQPLVGDLTAPDLGLSDAVVEGLGAIDHVVHCAAVYDITAAEDRQRIANVEGTRAVIGLARRLDATLHHVSSIAVAGTHSGVFTEEDFDLGQDLPTPYHRTKFDAERLVRTADGLRYRIYRPAVVVGDSRTGEMDKVDGPYYFFGVLSALARLPRFTPVMLPDSGRTNIVPVDYVVSAMTTLMHLDGRDGQTFHLTAPTTTGLREIYRGIASAAGLPPLVGSLPRAAAAPLLQVGGRAKILRNMAATQLGVPAEILDVVDVMPTFGSERTAEALRGSGIAVPEFGSYAGTLWRYWARHLDPGRARRDDPAGPLVGKHVIITGASSGIGRASAVAVAARGATVFALARNGEALEDVRDSAVDGCRVCDVTAERIRLPAGGADLGDQLLEGLAVARQGEHRRTACRDRHRRGAADAAGGAGDDDVLADQRAGRIVATGPARIQVTGPVSPQHSRIGAEFGHRDSTAPQRLCRQLTAEGRHEVDDVEDLGRHPELGCGHVAQDLGPTADLEQRRGRGPGQ